MIIESLTRTHIPQARALALENYREERACVPALPELGEDDLPSFEELADNGLGVAAVEAGRLLGFLGAWGPWDGVFTTPARGVFTPIHAHGAVEENRGLLYRRLYQAAAERWVRAGATSHGVALYTHDAEALKAFVLYGFGLRCVDAIRPMELIALSSTADGLVLRELRRGEEPLVRPLRRGLSAHLGASPCFMLSAEAEREAWIKRAEKRNSRVFAAFEGESAVAFVEVAAEGENFATGTPDMRNICGAYCLPEHRGRGLYSRLLNAAIMTLRSEGFVRLGVDFESFNPTAWSFWTKHFESYTYSVVRRIDESALGA